MFKHFVVSVYLLQEIYYCGGGSVYVCAGGGGGWGVQSTEHNCYTLS